MEFTNLNLLTSLVFITVAGGLTFLSYKLYFKQLKFNSEFKLLSTNKYFYIKYIFLLLSLFIVLFSIFGVRYGIKIGQNQSKGIDMMFVLDVSKSMNVADIGDSNYNYTRLDVIKDSISKFVVKNRENRFGLIIFAGDAISTIPLTTDHDLFLTFLKGVDYRNLTRQGSDFEKALRLGINRFNNSDDRSKSLVFISDGGDSSDIINKQGIQKLTEKNKAITYSIVGVGTNKGGRIITGKDMFGRYSFQRYRGEYVVSKINRNNLKDIASALNGDYFEVSNVGDLDKLNKSIDSLEKKVIKRNVNGELGDFGRQLSIFSFISFLLFLLLYLYEDKIYFLKKRYDK